MFDPRPSRRARLIHNKNKSIRTQKMSRHWLSFLYAWLMIFLVAASVPFPADATALDNHSYTGRQALSTTPSTIAKPQVLLLLIDRLDSTDIAQMPHLKQWQAAGAEGLMNVNTGGKRTDGNAYATLALGVPAKLNPSTLQVAGEGDVWQQDQPVFMTPSYAHTPSSYATSSHATSSHATSSYATSSYATSSYATSSYATSSHTPNSHAPSSHASTSKAQGVSILSMPRLEHRLTQSAFAATYGEAGDTLREHGLKAALYGADDRGPVPWRPAALLTADSQGQTRYGQVGADLFITAPERPYGIRTDYQTMWADFQKEKPELSFAVFDLGDLYRLSTYKQRLTPARYDLLHKQILQEIDRFAGRLLGAKQPNQLLLLVSPQVSTEAAARHEWLTPVFAVGSGIPAHAVLTSATTRRTGLVSNLDVLPTVLHFLNVPIPKDMIGYPLTGSTALAPERLDRMRQTLVWNYSHKSLVLGSVGALAGLFLLAAVLRLGFSIGLSIRRVRMLLFAVLSIPLDLFCLPLFHAQNLLETAGGLLALYLLFVAIPFRILPTCQTLNGRLLWIGAWTCGTVVVDTWQGGRLMHSSLLSYDPIVGARYYGVGNEYMGALVGAALLLYGALAQTKRLSERNLLWMAVLGGLLMTVFFASPALGTNTGGALTMAGTTALCYALQKRLSWPQTTLVLAMSLCIASLLLYGQNLYNSPPSHIGTAAHQVLTGGVQEFARILHRKSDMFFGILSASIGPALLVALLLVCTYWMLGQVKRQPKRCGRYEDLQVPFASLLLGAWIGLLTNDSGFVVAMMMMLFSLVPMLLVGLEQEQQLLEQLAQAEAA